MIKMLSRTFAMFNKGNIIRHKVRKDKDIIYGAQAMNIQLPPGHQRQTEDYDIYSKTPSKRARQLERKLDKVAGGDFYYVKEAMHKGTFKIMDKGFDNRKGTKDDFGVVDYTKPERKINTVTKNGVRYAHLNERVKDIKRSLKNPEFEYRHEKDRTDLMRIKQGKFIRSWL